MRSGLSKPRRWIDAPAPASVIARLAIRLTAEVIYSAARRFEEPVAEQLTATLFDGEHALTPSRDNLLAAARAHADGPTYLQTMSRPASIRSSSYGQTLCSGSHQTT
ncbi:hypothetical protein [Actinomadura rudentiformis]|uniref:Uncharacterized protein n=1 Tax=Actinomadura rudentiformis TaxID=359158 RepID=A0A6H9Y636_9ACTN|nr:hypothetical protein [Actinomadura rudentiformis]KAB2337050.1 hypothetical protein F8566_49470 [Actinomadura rudentiformis]